MIVLAFVPDGHNLEVAVAVVSETERQPSVKYTCHCTKQLRWNKMVTGKRRHGCVYSNVLNSIPKNTVKLDILNLSEIFLYRHSSVIQVWKGILLEKCIVTQFKNIYVNLMISFGLSTFHCNSSLNIYIRLLTFCTENAFYFVWTILPLWPVSRRSLDENLYNSVHRATFLRNINPLHYLKIIFDQG